MYLTTCVGRLPAEWHCPSQRSTYKCVNFPLQIKLTSTPSSVSVSRLKIRITRDLPKFRSTVLGHKFIMKLNSTIVIAIIAFCAQAAPVNFLPDLEARTEAVDPVPAGYIKRTEDVAPAPAGYIRSEDVAPAPAGYIKRSGDVAVTPDGISTRSKWRREAAAPSPDNISTRSKWRREAEPVEPSPDNISTRSAW